MLIKDLPNVVAMACPRPVDGRGPGMVGQA